MRRRTVHHQLQSVSEMAELIGKVLCCPDCNEAVGRDLRCAACGRSFLPDADRIISALPAAMQRAHASKAELETAIDAAAEGERGERVVLYEEAFHDEQAAQYDSIFADPLPVRSYYRHLVHAQIYRYLGDVPFIVDLCCGTGKSSSPLLERGVTVIGMDVSREMLRMYRRKCNGALNPILIQADASRPPLRRASCHAISMIGGLHHIPDRAGSLKTCCDALSVGGLLILHEPLTTGHKSRLARLIENVHAASDPVRVLNAVRRRIGLTPAARATASPAANFTPYERPFRSPDELIDALPENMKTLTIRAQGILSFREFAPAFQRSLGQPLAALVVRADEWLSRRRSTMWSGDALFAVFQKSA
jgi:SAM-dependent methyltransferase